MAENARIEAVKILQKLHLSHSYSHIALDNLLRKERFSDAERALLSRLVYGVEERRLTLDYMLACCCTRSLARLHPTVLEILRVGAYQLLFMDRIPVSAAVNEAVKATRSLKRNFGIRWGTILPVYPSVIPARGRRFLFGWTVTARNVPLIC